MRDVTGNENVKLPVFSYRHIAHTIAHDILRFLLFPHFERERRKEMTDRDTK